LETGASWFLQQALRSLHDRFQDKFHCVKVTRWLWSW